MQNAVATFHYYDVLLHVNTSN